VYRRTGSDLLRDVSGALTPAAKLMLRPWLERRLAIVNGFGTGLADDKLVHAYVDRMIGFYLDEVPLLGSVPTVDLNDPAAREEVLDDLSGYVIKPRHGQGGHGVVICAHANRREVGRIVAALRRTDAGASYVAQPAVALSVLQTVAGSELSERHIDLRPFAFATRTHVALIPGDLTRVALAAGALIVNSSQDGGVKDTWVLS
jgi:uncharacterized circularly permuted ATP-grasp superfamily protein